MLFRANAIVLAFAPAGYFCSPIDGNHAPSTSLAPDNGTKPMYRDASYCIDERVQDLVSRMTLEEKAGQMFQQRLASGPNGTLDNGTANGNSTDYLLGDLFLTHFNLVGDVTDPRETVKFVNNLQQRALDTRLGIPISLSSDPRHSFTENVGTGFEAGSFSQWPETLGFAALRDPQLMGKFADIAREEYTAVGLRVALHPQIDISTEPRWARIYGTMGENATLTSELLEPYLNGFHSAKFGKHSVSTVTKHFLGSGPVEDGEDSHFTYGKNLTYPGNNFEYHLEPFKVAIAAGTRQIMPAYSRPMGTQYPEVAMAFNKPIITGLLREQLGFDGIVVTDWGLVTDGYIAGQYMPARAWGLENTTEIERVHRILDAGCDQFGGEIRPELVVQVVEEGVVSEERLDVSVSRLMREKFALGLFDNPFVDAAAADRIVGNDYFTRLANETQRRSYTLLTNTDDTLPLTQIDPETKFYIEGFNASYIEERGFSVVDKPEDADMALMRMNAPAFPRSGGFESGYNSGSLEYADEEKERQAAIYAAVPSIVDIKMDRPAAIPEIFDAAAAVVANYGSGTEAFLDVVFGVWEPEGKLPFQLPRSLKAVEQAEEDVPYDAAKAVVEFGHGLSYAERDECS